ncbi:BamA/TamA family outer membrane protein [Rhodohalobacter mucosus]|uniref:BamA/TamA family outer membrane protein n=1 Tax=Rhodohalobacter mucosus TaxID=2079485 RepID=UPI001FA93913|nr:BamA/TamA family outer membrane protein [Rhodohalobacter mucosus]
MRHHFLPFIFLFFSLITLPCEHAFSQNNGQNTNTQAEPENDQREIVRKVRFTGNENVSDRALQTLVRTRTNREFLGIPRFTPWYYIHRVFGVGESPSYLDRELVSNDMDRIRIYYENLGYFSVRVDTTIIEYRPERVEVSFIIREGPASRIRSVGYTGLPEFDDPELSDEFYSESLFFGSLRNDSTFSVNRQYRAATLREEQTRIISFLRNHGFASVQRDSVSALIQRDTDNPQQLDVLYDITPGGFYTFGDVFINLSGPEGASGFNEESVLEGPPHALQGYRIDMQKQESAQTRFSLLSNQIQFMPGEPFDQSAYLKSVNSYQSLGMMLVNRFGLSEGGSLPDYSNSEIPVYFDLQTLPKHSIRAEFFGMRRTGFGTGAGINYTNNNSFGRAENLTLGVNGSIEFIPSNISQSDRATTYRNFETRAEYAIPRLNFPFAFLQNRNWVESSRTLYSLTYGQSSQEFFDVNSDIRLNLRYEVIHSERYRSFLDWIELDVIDIDISGGFRSALIEQFRDNENQTPEEIENKLEVQRILEDFRPQFSSIIRYTFRNQNTNLIKRDSGYFSEFSVALGGNIPYFIDRFLVSPGELQGTLTLPLGIFPSQLSYSRFVKLSADYRRYYPVTPTSVFAWRLFGGYATPIGQSESIPLNRRFFAGGSNDIRGYNPFLLGPGAIEDVSVPGGEIKLAAFTELRQVLFDNVLSAQWQLAWHTDAGNVWYGPGNRFLDEDDVDILEDGRFSFDTFYKQIPVSTGLGLRFDWEFLVARIDFTFRAKDLQKGWFKDRTPYFSFGIGHSF